MLDSVNRFDSTNQITSHPFYHYHIWYFRHCPLNNPYQTLFKNIHNDTNYYQ